MNIPEIQDFYSIYVTDSDTPEYTISYISKNFKAFPSYILPLCEFYTLTSDHYDKVQYAFSRFHAYRVMVNNHYVLAYCSNIKSLEVYTPNGLKELFSKNPEEGIKTFFNVLKLYTSFNYRTRNFGYGRRSLTSLNQDRILRNIYNQISDNYSNHPTFENITDLYNKTDIPNIPSNVTEERVIIHDIRSVFGLGDYFVSPDYFNADAVKAYVGFLYDLLIGNGYSFEKYAALAGLICENEEEVFERFGRDRGDIVVKHDDTFIGFRHLKGLLVENGVRFEANDVNEIISIPGNRRIEFRRKREKYELLMNYFPCTRVEFDGERVSASLSCMESIDKMEITEYMKYNSLVGGNGVGSGELRYFFGSYDLDGIYGGEREVMEFERDLNVARGAGFRVNIKE